MSEIRTTDYPTRIHKTAAELARIYSEATSELDLAHRWIETLMDRTPMMRTPDWHVAADAYMTRKALFEMETGMGGRGA